MDHGSSGHTEDLLRQLARDDSGSVATLVPLLSTLSPDQVRKLRQKLDDILTIQQMLVVEDAYQHSSDLESPVERSPSSSPNYGTASRSVSYSSSTADLYESGTQPSPGTSSSGFFSSTAQRPESSFERLSIYQAPPLQRRSLSYVSSSVSSASHSHFSHSPHQHQSHRNPVLTPTFGTHHHERTQTSLETPTSCATATTTTTTTNTTSTTPTVVARMSFSPITPSSSISSATTDDDRSPTHTKPGESSRRLSRPSGRHMPSVTLSEGPDYSTCTSVDKESVGEVPMALPVLSSLQHIIYVSQVAKKPASSSGLNKIRPWPKTFAVLVPGCLFYFKSYKSFETATDAFPLKSCEYSSFYSLTGKPIIHIRPREPVFYQSAQFQCEDDNEKLRWLSMLKRADIGRLWDDRPAPVPESMHPASRLDHIGNIHSEVNYQRALDRQLPEELQTFTQSNDRGDSRSYAYHRGAAVLTNQAETSTLSQGVPPQQMQMQMQPQAPAQAPAQAQLGTEHSSYALQPPSQQQFQQASQQPSQPHLLPQRQQHAPLLARVDEYGAVPSRNSSRPQRPDTGRAQGFRIAPVIPPRTQASRNYTPPPGEDPAMVEPDTPHSGQSDQDIRRELSEIRRTQTISEVDTNSILPENELVFTVIDNPDDLSFRSHSIAPERSEEGLPETLDRTQASSVPSYHSKPESGSASISLLAENPSLPSSVSKSATQLGEYLAHHGIYPYVPPSYEPTDELPRYDQVSGKEINRSLSATQLQSLFGEKSSTDYLKSSGNAPLPPRWASTTAYRQMSAMSGSSTNTTHTSVSTSSSLSTQPSVSVRQNSTSRAAVDPTLTLTLTPTSTVSTPSSEVPALESAVLLKPLVDEDESAISQLPRRAGTIDGSVGRFASKGIDGADIVRATAIKPDPLQRAIALLEELERKYPKSPTDSPCDSAKSA
ncbi:uncharacterized protein BJ171DRAFT_580979 [Polychytrium aggregatum]|uniref:uncharacterized protein n=1 Tax=Polychytrium aggregatum TaxID=110093 RepID=UPI0022FE9115|nr:uncharacterized protein BJ171DRAFT_580979 [Polychytrium aggregatum]KAI9205294.1 hypothetical protein BJ171DRAFT_580979 [Polychytrium aggregatum]